MASETYEFEVIGIFYQIKVMRFKQMSYQTPYLFLRVLLKQHLPFI